MEKVTKSLHEWRTQLGAPAFNVCRKKGTERPHSGEYNKHDQAGNYNCICCDLELFKSDHKFDSGTGWPSFYEKAPGEAVVEKADNGLFMRRTEVLCARCDSHLGHVFPDGPAPTGLRYCINSVSLKFNPS